MSSEKEQPASINCDIVACPLLAGNGGSAAMAFKSAFQKSKENNIQISNSVTHKLVKQ